MAKLEALVVEDEATVRLAIVQTLELAGAEVQTCANVAAAQRLLDANYGGVIITDVRLPGGSGLELLAHIAALDADLPVIVMTGHGHVSMAVEAMRAGAYDFIEKPFAAERLLESVCRAQEKRRLVLENRRLRQAWMQQPDLPALIGHAPALERLRQMIASLGPTPVDVLLIGQTGSGKEVVARHLHAASGRSGLFVAINCGALPESVFESEIFGHEAGAFTGAQKRRIGKLEHARGGTVFLDEIESMPLALQVKLLRVLQERSLERLGGNDSIALDCRIIAATKVDLLAHSRAGHFREDLVYRLNVVTIPLPSLDERREDIPLLLGHFMQLAALRYQRALPTPSAVELQNWQGRPWPGNVRELRNFAERLVLGVEPVCTSDHEAASNASLPERVDAYESALIAEALRTHEGNVADTALSLGMPKKTLYDKIRKYQLPTR